MSWLRRPLGKRKREEELEEEVRNHLEMVARDRVDRGVTSEGAKHSARREFGNLELVREVTREALVVHSGS
jgi:hypothetical protein